MSTPEQLQGLLAPHLQYVHRAISRASQDDLAMMQQVPKRLGFQGCGALSGDDGLHWHAGACSYNGVPSGFGDPRFGAGTHQYGYGAAPSQQNLSSQINCPAAYIQQGGTTSRGYGVRQDTCIPRRSNATQYVQSQPRYDAADFQQLGNVLFGCGTAPSCHSTKANVGFSGFHVNDGHYWIHAAPSLQGNNALLGHRPNNCQFGSNTSLSNGTSYLQRSTKGKGKGKKPKKAKLQQNQGCLEEKLETEEGQTHTKRGKGRRAKKDRGQIPAQDSDVPGSECEKDDEPKPQRPGKLTRKATALGLTPNEMSDLVEEEFKRRRDANPEPTREEQPLELLKERAIDPQSWSILLANEHLRSWMTLKHEPAITVDDFWELYEKVPWLELHGDGSTRLTRSSMWYTRSGCTCSYQYGKTHVHGSPIPEWLDAMSRRWFSSLQLDDDSLPNCLNLNLYESSRQNVSWHADDERLFMGKFQDTCIISISLGETRTFEIGLRAPRRGGVIKPEKGSLQSFRLSHGHICTMEGLVQKHYLHQIRKGGTKGAKGGQGAADHKGAGGKGARINATFRYIKEHQTDCPLCVPLTNTPCLSVGGRKGHGKAGERPVANVS